VEAGTTDIQLWTIMNYESEFTRIRSYIALAPQNQKHLLTRCSTNFDPIFDPITIAKCSQMVTVGHIGGGNRPGKPHIGVQESFVASLGCFGP